MAMLAPEPGRLGRKVTADMHVTSLDRPNWHLAMRRPPPAQPGAFDAGLGKINSPNHWETRTGKRMAPHAPRASDEASFPSFARAEDGPRGGRRPPPPAAESVERPHGMRRVEPPHRPENNDPFAFLPSGRKHVPEAVHVALTGPATFPAQYSESRAFPAMHEQRYTCWRPETLGAVSQWSDGPGVYNTTNVAEPKGKQLPYVVNGRGGRRGVPQARTQNIPFTGPFHDALGKPIDYALRAHGGSLGSRMFAGQDLQGQNPYLLAESNFSSSKGLEPPPRVAHPPHVPFNALGESLSRMEFQ